MLALRYTVPMLGAVLNMLDTRLDGETVAYIVDHSRSRIVIADTSADKILAAAGEAEVRVIAVAGPAGWPEEIDAYLDDVEALVLSVDENAGKSLRSA